MDLGESGVFGLVAAQLAGREGGGKSVGAHRLDMGEPLALEMQVLRNLVRLRIAQVINILFWTLDNISYGS